MTFAFRETTVSGLLLNVEGTSKYIKVIEDVLINDMGWALAEDSTALAGANHKLILHNNGGESGSDPNYYLILTSGTTNEIGLQIATAWTVGSPGSVPGSGVGPAPTNTTTMTLETDEDGLFIGWIVGDKDAVNFVTRIVTTANSTDYDLSCVGRCLQFHDETLEPYSVYLFGSASASTIVESTNVTGLVGNNPVIALGNSADGEIQFYAHSTVSEPWSLDETPGAVEKNFTAMPYLWNADDTVNKGSMGLLRHIWSINATGLPDETIMQDRTTNDEYIVFNTGSIRSFILRKT